MGRVLWGLSDREFWGMAPRGFAALMKVHSENEERKRMEADYRAGVIAAEIRNKLRGQGQPSVRPTEFFASLRDTATRQQTPEEMRATFRAFARAHNRREAAHAA